MSLSLAQMRAGVYKATATNSGDWENGNTDIDLYINRSWWDISDRFDFRDKETNLVFPTVAGIRDYDLTNKIGSSIFDALQRISIEDINDFSHKDLILVSDFDYENEYVNDSSFQNKPTNYLRFNKYLRLYPTPDQAYNLTVYYWKILSDVPSQGVSVPQSWHEIVQFGANWRALLDLQDYDKSERMRIQQESLISDRTPVKVKELADTKYAHVEVPGREY